MVDERMSMTFSVRNNPGRYALLLGSGVSTGAEIPTGWDVVNKLIKRIAVAEDSSIDADMEPAEWYKEIYGEPATYENLIGGLADTPTERRQLLEEFFEPSEEEEKRGEKQPTEAHESIAWLVDNGYVDVILTTNFDQLIEKALRNQGVNPKIVSDPGEASGAEPLQHQDAVVIKVNGDYTKTNIKNLSSELDSYSESMQQIIDRVFHEYGLIICGWSGKYDTRLRESLQECETHRYSTFWTYYSELGTVAEELIASRNAFTIHHDGAASLFSDLRDRVRALEDAEEGEPLTTSIARERIKRYLPREEHKIDLADLIRNTAKEASMDLFDEDKIQLHDSKLPDDFRVEDRYQTYGELTRKVITVLMTCAYWGGDTANSGVSAVSDSFSILTPNNDPRNGYKDHLAHLRRYPATLGLYGVGVAGLGGENWPLITSILSEPIDASRLRRGSVSELPSDALHPRRLTRQWTKGLATETAESSVRDSIKDTLQDPAMDFFTSESAYESSFKRFELILDLMWYAKGNRGDLVTLGTTYWTDTIDELEAEITKQGGDWPLIRDGVILKDSGETTDILDTIRGDL